MTCAGWLTFKGRTDPDHSRLRQECIAYVFSRLAAARCTGPQCTQPNPTPRPPGAGTCTRKAGLHATTRDKRNKHATRQTRPTRPQPKQQSPRQAARRTTRNTHAHRPPTDATHTARDNATTDNTRRDENNNAKAAQRQLRRPPHQKSRPTTRAPRRTRNLRIRRHACAEARADAPRQQPTTRRIRQTNKQ